MKQTNSAFNVLIKCFDLVGAYYSWAARKVIKAHILSAQSKSAKALKVYLCPDNCILMIEVDGERILSKSDLSSRFLLEVFHTVTKEEYYLTQGYRVQHATYEADINDQKGTFEVFTLPLTNAQ